MFKKIYRKIKYWCLWLFSRKVGQAINEGADYCEVEAMIQEMLNK